MNLLEMYKALTDEEKQEFIKEIIKEINKKNAEIGKLIIRTF